jgi:hypothetical protein
MSISLLSNYPVGHELGIAYLTDVENSVAGVSAIQIDDADGDITYTGNVRFFSNDSSIQITNSENSINLETTSFIKLVPFNPVGTYVFTPLVDGAITNYTLTLPMTINSDAVVSVSYQNCIKASGLPNLSIPNNAPIIMAYPNSTGTGIIVVFKTNPQVISAPTDTIQLCVIANNYRIPPVE